MRSTNGECTRCIYPLADALMCLDNVKINQLFGVNSGLGMGLFTFDWAQISYVGSPLMVPWWAEVHIMLGFVLFFWILCPLMYYGNVSFRFSLSFFFNFKG